LPRPEGFPRDSGTSMRPRLRRDDCALSSTLDVDPHFIAAHNFAGLGYISKGMYEAGAAEFREALGLSGWIK